MLALFLNPGFLVIAGALISVPIIIHLINRMRFKRIRWAAMEFLLKAQKRTRKRLIIEQLLLLAMRCFLIGLVGLLVSRFIGCSDTGLGGKPNLHLVLLDDTLSMQDQWKQDGALKNCFEVAKNDVLLKKIAKGLSQAKTNERLVILPLSKINDPEFQAKVYEGLVNEKQLEELTRDIAEMQPSMVHVNMLQGVKTAEKIVANHADSRVTLHILSDFRHKDWGGAAGEGLTKELLDLAAKNKDMKIRPLDTVFPPRGAGQGSYPASRDNVGIVDIRPSTRIAGKNMPVQFTVTIQNFSGKQVEASLNARDETTGKEMFDVNFNPPNPLKLSPSSLTTVTFEKRFNPDIKPGESHFAHLTVRLTSPQMTPLDNDGLMPDNLRHAVVEVRDKVPILVIDGDPKGREESKDSFIIGNSLLSVPGRSYQVIFGDELVGGGDPTKALERADLNKFPTIFLLNVQSLKPKQLANLENFVKDGGGVAFYLGPLVAPEYYNKSLYKEGKGIFPAPLKAQYYPGPTEDALKPKGGDTFQLLVRDDKFPGQAVPIFGAVIEEPKHKEPLRYLHVGRYFQVPRNLWKPEPGRVFELATLPNDAPVSSFEQTVADITRGNVVASILANPELKQFRARLEMHLRDIENTVRPGSEAKAYNLATRIDALLNDKGSVAQKVPDLTELWANSDPKVQSLLRDLKSLREQVSYGDPFLIAQSFGKGKVVAIMSTAGKEWNDWSGGSVATVLFEPFVWEMQNYLSSRGSEANLSVGSNLDLVLDAEQFKGAQLKMVRHFMKLQSDKPAERVKAGEQFGRADNGRIVFTMNRNLEPGLYVTEIVDDNAPGKAPLTVLGHAFNVDTLREGDLQRVGTDELDRELLSKSNGQIVMIAPGAPDEALLGKFNDFSESPWLFLNFLLVLVAEQALAVHLSFHMKANESDMPAGAAGVKAAA